MYVALASVFGAARKITATLHGPTAETSAFVWPRPQVVCAQVPSAFAITGSVTCRDSPYRVRAEDGVQMAVSFVFASAGMGGYGRGFSLPLFKLGENDLHEGQAFVTAQTSTWFTATTALTATHGGLSRRTATTVKLRCCAQVFTRRSPRPLVLAARRLSRPISRLATDGFCGAIINGLRGSALGRTSAHVCG